MTVAQLLKYINAEDKKVPVAVNKALPQIEKLIQAIVLKMKEGRTLFYIGAGTSGRIGVVDASECPPSFGVPHGLVIAIMAGGNKAMFKAVENAEDDIKQGWLDLKKHKITKADVVIGIAASGTTPYVINALKKCNEYGIITGSISCNKNTPVSAVAKYPIEVVPGPEFITGSTRMKSGTAQKLVLNMISSSVMIQLGRVEDNKMVNMMLTNEKLVDRGTKMIMEKKGVKYEAAKKLLLKYGSVKNALIKKK
jgi:N-acetylmuramic acid 6-phosphate etherase